MHGGLCDVSYERRAHYVFSSFEVGNHRQIYRNRNSFPCLPLPALASGSLAATLPTHAMQTAGAAFVNVSRAKSALGEKVWPPSPLPSQGPGNATEDRNVYVWSNSPPPPQQNVGGRVVRERVISVPRYPPPQTETDGKEKGGNLQGVASLRPEVLPPGWRPAYGANVEENIAMPQPVGERLRESPYCYTPAALATGAEVVKKRRRVPIIREEIEEREVAVPIHVTRPVYIPCRAVTYKPCVAASTLDDLQRASRRADRRADRRRRRGAGGCRCGGGRGCYSRPGRTKGCRFCRAERWRDCQACGKDTTECCPCVRECCGSNQCTTDCCGTQNAGKSGWAWTDFSFLKNFTFCSGWRAPLGAQEAKERKNNLVLQNSRGCSLVSSCCQGH